MPRLHVWDKKSAQRLNISYAVSMRGTMDDEPWLVFVGGTKAVIENLFRWLTAGGHTARGFCLQEEHAAVRRIGHHYFRLAVRLTDCNETFATLDDLRLIIESRLMSEGHRVTYYADYQGLLDT